MITRSFGDFALKIRHDMAMKMHTMNYVTCDPDIRFVKVNFETDTFLLMASDGVFDRLSSQDACDFIVRELKAQPIGKHDARAIAKKLAHHAMYDRKVIDNVTIMLILFPQMPPQET